MKSEKLLTAADGTQIHYSVAGRGPPMILCDGLGCNGFIWKYFAPYFHSRFRVYRWHYRGHGSSETPADKDRVRIADLRADLAALIAHEGIERAVLAGHSMGVQIILDFATHYPERVEALIPVCGSYRRPLTTFHGSAVADKLFPYLNRVVQNFPAATQKVWNFACRSPLAYSIASTFEANGDFIQRADFQPYFDHLASVDASLFFRMLADLNAHDLSGQLGNIKAPTLIVAGERDNFTPGWLSLDMHHHIAGSELLMIPGGTHTAPIEFPDLVNLRSEKFLRERVPLRAAA